MATRQSASEKLDDIEEKLDRLYEDDDDDGEIIEHGPAKLSDTLTELYSDDEVTLTVTRKIKGGRKTAFLFEIDDYTDLPSLQTKLRDEYGGGEFFIEGRKQGKWVLKHELNIEKPLVNKTEEKASGEMGEISRLIMAVQESSQRNTEIMQTQISALNDNMRLSQIEAAKSQSEMLLRMMELNANNNNNQTSPMDLLGLMIQMKELTESKSDSMDTLLKGLELGRELGGDNNESVLQTALKSIGGPLSKMASSLNLENPSPNLPKIQQQKEPANNKQIENDNNEDQTMLKFMRFKPVLDMLIKGANANGDPDVYANLVLDQLENDDEILNDYILTEENYLKLYDFAPQLTNIKPWLDKVRETIIACTFDEPEPELDVDVHGQTHDEQSANGGFNETAPVSDTSGESEFLGKEN